MSRVLRLAPVLLMLSAPAIAGAHPENTGIFPVEFFPDKIDAAAQTEHIRMRRLRFGVAEIQWGGKSPAPVG